MRFGAWAPLLLALLSLPAQAGCSRLIRVPLAPMGNSLVVAPDGRLSGAFPVLLGKLESQGCRFAIEPMPRARAEMLFKKAGADLLMPASRTVERDAIAEFVPLTQTRPLLVQLQREELVAPRSVAELLDKTALRVVLVRGYDYGPAYRDLEAGLQQRGRLVLEASPLGVARALATGLADATVLNPGHLHGVMESEPRLQALRPSLRNEVLAELDWSDSGLYLSTRSLSRSDRQQLRRVFEQAVRSGLYWQTLIAHHPGEVLEGSQRPRD
jgi:polar amino acid transport system substrate-binding protein